MTVHGRDEVVVIALTELRSLQDNIMGDALIAAMQSSPHRDVDIEPSREAMPVREVVV